MQKEILYCNLKILFKNEIIEVKEVVYKENDGYYENIRLFKNPVKVIKVEVIKSLGFESNINEFTIVQKSDEKRNNINGAYE